jgi:hypothetical protein
MRRRGYLVALLGSTGLVVATATTLTTSTLSRWVGTVTRDVASLTALVAGLVLWTLWALSACHRVSFQIVQPRTSGTRTHVSLTTTVVAILKSTQASGQK